MPEVAKQLVAVAVGGALGALLRYGTALLALRVWAEPLPLATWAANLLGCFLMGLLVPLVGRPGAEPAWRLLLLVGFLGSYTTFSTFSLETVVLWEQGHPGAALLNAVGSVILGLVAVALGLWLGRSVAA